MQCSQRRNNLIPKLNTGDSLAALMSVLFIANGQIALILPEIPPILPETDILKMEQAGHLWDV